MNKLEELLKKHDWSFEYSDDMTIVRKGYESLKAIKLLIKTDEDKELFNKYNKGELK